jgi:hypothetical protein
MCSGGWFSVTLAIAYKIETESFGMSGVEAPVKRKW